MRDRCVLMFGLVLLCLAMTAGCQRAVAVDDWTADLAAEGAISTLVQPAQPAPAPTPPPTPDGSRPTAPPVSNQTPPAARLAPEAQSLGQAQCSGGVCYLNQQPAVPVPSEAGFPASPPQANTPQQPAFYGPPTDHSRGYGRPRLFGWRRR